MKRDYLHLIKSALIFCCCCTCFVLSDARTHTIQKGETLFKVAQLYRVSEQVICALNPGLSADNFKIGSTINIPDNNLATGTDGTNFQGTHKAKKKETLFSIASLYGITVDELKAANPKTLQSDYQLKKGDILNIPFPTPFTPATSTTAETATIQTKELSVVHACIVLPFKGGSTQNNQMIEFYRGLLLAVNDMKEQGISFDISTFDAPAGSSIQKLLSNDAFTQADIIFGSPDSLQIAQLGNFAKEKGKVFVNPFYRWSLQTDVNPNIFTLNPTPKILCANALKVFQRTFQNANIILLETTEPMNAFIQNIKDSYVIEKLPFPNSKKEIAAKLQKKKENIIIPSSSDLRTFNLLQPIVAQLRTENPNYNICLFGFPFWQSWAESRTHEFQAANTYLFTPFFLNRATGTFQSFEKKYTDGFKQSLNTNWPPMAVYGYDCAMHFLRGIAAFGNSFTTQVIYAQPIAYPFNMKKSQAGGGFVNHNVQILHYSPSNVINCIKADN